MAHDGSLIFDTRIDQKGFKDGLNKLKSTGTKALKAVGTVAATAGTAIAAMGAYATKTSIDFESAFAGVRKTVDATEEEFAMLEKGIRDMAKRLPQSASAIAEVGEAAGQLGIRTENILGFTETMVMLGDATNMSSDQAATALARLANITGMSQDDFDRLGSSIVELGNNLATTEAEIVEMSLRLAGTASQVGMTEHEMLALAGAMSSVGINAEAGGSSMSRAMQKINTEVLSGGENLSKFAEISNMSVDEFSKAWKERPTDAITAFIKGLDDVNASGGDVTTMLKDLGMNSIQEVDTLLRLSGASDVLTDALGMSAGAWEENIALADEAAQRYETTESMIQILKNNVDDLAISVGDGLKEGFRGGIGTAIEMVEQLADAFEAGGIAGLVEEIGTVLADVAVKITEFAPTMLEAASNMILSFVEGIRSNQETIGLAAVDLIQDFIMIMLEIIPEVLVLGIELITTFTQGMAEAIPELIPMAMNAIETITNSLMENLPLILDAGVQILISLIQGMAEALPDLMTMAIDLVILLADKVIENLPLIMEAGLQIIIALIQGIIENLPTLIEHVPRIINAFFDTIIENLPMVLQAGWEIIKMLVVGIIEAIPVIIKNLPAIIRAIVNVITMYNWAQLGKNIMGWLKDGIMKMPGKIAQAGKHIAKAGWDAIKNIFADAPRLGKGFIKWLIDGILGMLGNLVSSAGSLAKSAFSAIKGIFSGAPGLGKDFVKWLGNGIKSMFSNLASIAKDLGSSAIKAVKGIFKGMPNIGKYFVQGIWSGIASLTGWIGSKIAGFAKNLVKGFKNFFKISSPSKIMKDEIGENLTLGIGVGIEEGMPELHRDIDKEMAALTDKMKATVDLEAGSIGARVSANSIGTASQTITVDTANDNEKIDYDRLGEATVRAFVRSGIGISVNNREFGRLVADSLGERRG